jgi:hypothetical protein
MVVATPTWGATVTGTVSIDYNPVTRRLFVQQKAQLAGDGPFSVVSYLEALEQPYRPGDVDRLWDYPASPEGAEILRYECNPCGDKTAAGWSVGPGTVNITLEAILPRKYGALGVTKEQSLLTAIVPFVVEHAAQPRQAHAVPVRWQLSYHLAYGQWLFQPPVYDGDPAAFVLAAALRGYETIDGSEKGPIVRPAKAPRRAADPDAPPRSLPQEGLWAAPPDVRLLEAHKWIAGALGRYGIAAQRWVVGALRREPAACGDDVLIVSRELFRATPFKEVMDFHRFGLARRAIACAAKKAYRLSSEDADAVGVFIMRRLLNEENGKLVSPRDLLRPLSFIPDIDSLIYAPQMPWADVYFLAVDEPRAGPPQPDAFFHGRPRGKLYLEKLLDRVGQDLVDTLMGKAIESHLGISVVAKDTLPTLWDAIEQDFGGAYPAFDASFRVEGNEVHVLRDGPGAGARDPITVKVEDATGKEHSAKAIGLSADEIVAFTAATLPLKEVELDPDRRLVEYHFKANAHPRFNNATSHRLRVRLNRLSAALALSSGASAAEVFAGVDMSIRREYDLNHVFGFGANYDPSAFSFYGRYTYSFGPRITPDHLGYHLSTQVWLERLTKGFAGATGEVYQTVLYTSLGYDDRPSDRTSMRGFGWNVYAALGLPIGAPVYGYAGASVLGIINLADAHAIALRLRAGSTIGPAPEQNKLALGGRFNARGFPLGEATRNVRVTASAEYRHELFRDFRASLFDAVYLDGVEGALFADAVFLSDDFPGLVRYENMFFDVGYGIRFLFDQIGVNPGVLAIDVGVPLKRVDKSLFPVTVYVDFVQSFASF